MGRLLKLLYHTGDVILAMFYWWLKGLVRFKIAFPFLIVGYCEGYECDVSAWSCDSFQARAGDWSAGWFPWLLCLVHRAEWSWQNHSQVSLP